MSTLSVLLALSLWTYAIPEIRIPAFRSLPIPYLVLVPLVFVVALENLRGPLPLGSRERLALLLGPALISVGTLIGYLFHAGEASGDVAWRVAILPWVIPVLVLALARQAKGPFWQALTGGLLVLLAYGMYGFATGRIGDPGEHTLNYFGIHYTPSTRNGDVLYFLILFFHLLGTMALTKGRTANLAIGLAGLTSAAVILTQSRNAWISLLVGILAWVATTARIGRWNHQTRLRMVAVLTVTIIVVVAVDAWRGTGVLLFRRAGAVLAGDPGGSLQDRLKLAAIALNLIGSHPLLGIGPGTVRHRIEQSGVHLDQVAANHVENSFLQVWLDAGVLGFIGFLLLWSWLLFGPRARGLGGDNEVRFVCAKGLVAALLIYMLFNVTFDNLAMWVFVGLAAAYHVNLPWKADLTQDEVLDPSLSHPAEAYPEN